MTKYDIVIDIETIPTQDVTIIAKLKEKVSPPGNYKSEEAIKKWWATTGQQKLVDVVSGTALKGAMGEVIAIGFQVGEENPTCLARKLDEPEGDMLAEFTAHMDVAVDGNGLNYRIIGHNVGWDCRFLWQRGVITGAHIPDWFPVEERSKRIYDTMREWAGWKEMISLDALAYALLGEGKDMNGGQVWDLVQAGDYDTLMDYCLKDVELTRRVYEGMTGHDC